MPIGPERFEKYQDKTVSINWNEVLKKPNIVINALKEAGLIDKNLEMKSKACKGKYPIAFIKSKLMMEVFKNMEEKKENYQLE